MTPEERDEVAATLRSKAEEYERLAARHPDWMPTLLGYRSAYRDAANLIQTGEVAW